MGILGRLIISSIMVISGSSHVMAQSSNTAAPFDDAGIRTLLNVCAPYIGNVSGAESYLQTAGFAHAPTDFAARILKGAPGSVWLMPPPDRVAVVTQPDGLLCRVYVQGGDVDKEKKYFVRLIDGITTPGVFVTKTSEQDINQEGFTIHYIAYRVGATAPKPGVVDRLFSIGTNPSPNAPMSTAMTVAAAKPDKVQ